MILIDGDILIYRAGFAAQYKRYRFVRGQEVLVYFDKNTKKESIPKTLKSLGYTKDDGKLQQYLHVDPAGFACHSLKLMMNTILSKCGDSSNNYRCFLTSNDKTNYRFDIAKTKPYKGNRKAPKPKHYDALREYLINVYKAELISGKEADDAMGIVQTELDGCAIIVSIDKDMLQIPGTHYNFVTDVWTKATDPGGLTFENNRTKLLGTGIKWFFAQMLLGDSADNIPGISGFGPVKVYECLAEKTTFKEMAFTVYEIYKENGVSNRFLEVADLLWIQRKENQMVSVPLAKLIGERKW